MLAEGVLETEEAGSSDSNVTITRAGGRPSPDRFAMDSRAERLTSDHLGSSPSR
jgi:hypothetical protein